MSTQVEKTQEKEYSFGNGRYSKAASEFWKDLQRLFKISPDASEKITQHWMRDFGAAMKNQEVSVTVTGKPGKEGELTLKEAAKAKVIATYPISMMRLCAYLDEALRFGLLPNRCEYVLTEQLDKYVSEMKEKPENK